jgi:hypothetical protein
MRRKSLAPSSRIWLLEFLKTLPDFRVITEFKKTLEVRFSPPAFLCMVLINIRDEKAEIGSVLFLFRQG